MVKKSLTREDKTVEYYDKTARSWANKPKTINPDRDRQLKKFYSILPKGKILEIGAGCGDDAEALGAFGYEYYGTDASREEIKAASERNPGLNFFHMSVYDLDFQENLFDGFWASAVLLHIPKARIGGALQAIRKVSKKDAVGFISIKKGSGEEEDSKTGRWFALYSQKGFEEILRVNGLDVISKEISKDEREGMSDWLVFYVRVIK